MSREPLKDMPFVSVIICTHNPRADYFARVLEALKQQTLSRESWELLLIDNASRERLESGWDLTWHPHARHLREDELGLTPARLRGIKEARGPLLVFVDDDNVLAPDYLDHAVRVEAEWPILGAWGGDIVGEFETEPEPWTRPYLGHPCIRECKKARWSNSPEDWNAFPYGAGLCIRADVAAAYARQRATAASGIVLDRRGASLMSAGDVDMVLYCLQLGLGFGRFPELGMKHLIATRRVTEDYLVELVGAVNRSAVLVGSIHGYDFCRTDKLRDSALWNLVRLGRLMSGRGE